MARRLLACAQASKERHMKETTLSLPELALVAGTRAVLGIGAGLLLANALTKDQRNPLGLALVGIGVLTTIPLAFEVIGGGRLHSTEAPARGA
jgi:hypothetical protein